MLAANEAVAGILCGRGLDVLVSACAAPSRTASASSELAYGFGWSIPSSGRTARAARSLAFKRSGQPSSARCRIWRCARSTKRSIPSTTSVTLDWRVVVSRTLRRRDRRYPDSGEWHRLLKVILQQRVAAEGPRSWPPRKEMKEWATDCRCASVVTEVERRGFVTRDRALMRERIGERSSGTSRVTSAVCLCRDRQIRNAEGLAKAIGSMKTMSSTIKTPATRRPNAVRKSAALGSVMGARTDSVSVP